LRRVIAAGFEAAGDRARRHRPRPDHAFSRRSFRRTAVSAAGRAVHATNPSAGHRRTGRVGDAADAGHGSTVREFVQDKFGAVKVTPFAVVHGESGGPFLAYRVEAEGRIIAYSADTEWTETLIGAARGADLFIAEAYTYEKELKNHLSLQTLEAHLPEIKARRLVLTHMSDDMLGRLDGLAHTAASDGMIVEF
jgi:ribonuclease BN (tRNA processing enzyme)